MNSLIMFILPQTEHASADWWSGAAGRDKTATSNNTGHRLGPGLFLYLEGRRLDWKGKNALAQHTRDIQTKSKLGLYDRGFGITISICK